MLLNMPVRRVWQRRIDMTVFLIILAVIVGLFLLTFAIYWFNLDMKLVRFVYDKLQPHYDKMKRDKKL